MSTYNPLLFWDPDGWCVDLREARAYPIYGEWDWVARTNNTGMEATQVSEYAEPELLEEKRQASSEDLIEQIRGTLEIAVDIFNHRDDFVALDELAARLAALDDDDAVLRGVSAVRKQLKMRVGNKRAHAAAFRNALRGG